MKKFIISQITESIELKQNVLHNEQLIGLIAEISQAAVQVYKNGHKLLIAGNGGSAADAQHIAGELINRLNFDHPALPAIALTTDTSVLTAIGNDSGYEQIFKRQIEALGDKGDMFLGISTSGNSPNILAAFRVCQEKGLVRVGLTGQAGGEMAGLCDYCVNVPSNDTPRIQEVHILISHILCSIIEESIFGKGM